MSGSSFPSPNSNMPGPAVLSPLEPKNCTITFQNLSYKHEVKGHKSMNPISRCFSQRVRVIRQLLYNISGVMKPGLNAIIGSSGSGKSSLLGVLSRRVDPQLVTGNVRFNGLENPKNLGGIAGFVIQNDNLMGVLTVKENIWFSANLRLPNSVTFQEKNQRVNEIITQLSLESCQDTRVGSDVVGGISGGERKRVKIGMELVTQPCIIFLDEPTSGLDASTAQEVMMVLKLLALKATNVIFTTHQPSCSIYQLFDSLTIIGKGRLIFHFRVEYALAYFHSIGYECPEDENPAEFFQDVVSGDVDVELGRFEVENGMLSQEQITFRVERLATLFRNSSLNANLIDEIEVESKAGDAKQLALKLYAQKSTFLTQILYLSQRAFRSLVRNPMALVANAIMNLLIGFMFGLICFQVDDSFTIGCRNRFGFVFFVSSNMLFGSFGAIDLFAEERDMFLHEHKSGHYSVLAYFLSKLFADLLPLRTIGPLLFCCVTYWMVGLKPDAGSFFFYVLTVLLLVYSAAGIGMLYSASFRDHTIATFVIAMTFMLSILLNGFLIRTDSLLPWLRWIEYLSIARYGFVALCINEFHNRTFRDCLDVANRSESLSTNQTTMSRPNYTPSGQSTIEKIMEFLTTSPSPTEETMEYMTNSSQSAFVNHTKFWPISESVIRESIESSPNDTVCFLVHGDEILKSKFDFRSTDYTDFTGWLFWQNHVALVCITVISFLLTYVKLVRAARRNY